ncbi:hypothetical protein Pfo_019657 [Paulownia fortunei]|nr:hypothetical protein Pfo_019657 [Paulownia fortunei]
MAIVISVILLFVGIGVLILIHVWIVGRTLRRGLTYNNVNMVERGSFGSTSMDQPPADCAVCLENFRVGEKCRLLPSCNHSFHAECVDLWLLRSPICPICRAGADIMKSGSLFGEESNSFRESGIEFRDGQTTETSLGNEAVVHIAGIQAGESGNSDSTGADLEVSQAVGIVDYFPGSQTGGNLEFQ